MSGVFQSLPAHGTFDATGLDRIPRLDPLAVPGVLAVITPGLWETAGVPAGTVPNQSLWAQDQLGVGARDLVVGSSITSGLIERTTKGAIHVAHRRTAAATTNETFRFENQTIRDFIAQNHNHRYLLCASIGITRAGAASWTVAPSHRIMGFVDATNATIDRMTIRANPARDTLAGYPPNNPPRVLAQNTPATGGRGVVAAVFDGFTQGTLGTSPTLLSFHNGGAGSPGLCYKLFFAWIEDLTVSKRVGSEVLASLNARHDTQQGAGGLYEGDTHTDPAQLT